MSYTRLVATLGYKAKGSIPKVLYIGHDADEAKAAMTAATDKGFFEIRVCREIDLNGMFIHRAEPIKV